MVHIFKDNRSIAELRLTYGEKVFDRDFYRRDRKDKLLTIAWNTGEDQTVNIDNIDHAFPANSVLSLMVNQTFRFSKPEDILAWQFNRDFYCIVNHDEEVSCVGFLFYGSAQTMFVRLDEVGQRKLRLLLEVFKDEFGTADNIQFDMLQMLLKRLIIIITRLAKQQYITDPNLSKQKFDIVRKYNLLVENNYRKHHQVKFYAEQLNRSPKTLSNLFMLYNHKSPLMVIQERVLLEAKRLLVYTDKTAKEIAHELGFEDAAYFSNFFKKHTSVSPSDFRNSKSSFSTANNYKPSGNPSIP